MDTNKSAIAIVIRDDKVLVVKRKSGSIAFPGGFIHQGEHGYRAAERETGQETGIRIKANPESLNTHNLSRRFYEARYLGGDIIPQRKEVTDAMWLPISEAWRKLSYGSNKRYLKKVLEQSRHNSME